jgi:hypothetical protein
MLGFFLIVSQNIEIRRGFFPRAIILMYFFQTKDALVLIVLIGENYGWCFWWSSRQSADLLRSLSGISIIHNPSRIMYKTAFLLYIMGLEKCQILPPFLVSTLFLDNLTPIMYTQNQIIYNTEKFYVIHNLIFFPHFK